jgi:aromatic ring hydroxylase
MTDETSATIPYTGREFIDSLDDGREVWIYGERVGKITEHPARAASVPAGAPIRACREIA